MRRKVGKKVVKKGKKGGVILEREENEINMEREYSIQGIKWRNMESVCWEEFEQGKKHLLELQSTIRKLLKNESISDAEEKSILEVLEKVDKANSVGCLSVRYCLDKEHRRSICKLIHDYTNLEFEQLLLKC